MTGFCMLGAVLLLVVLRTTGLAQNAIALSPDGRWVAYVSIDTLRIVATRGGGSPIAVAAVTTFAVPRWAPDSYRLAYYSVASGSMQLWVYDRRSRARKSVSAVPGGIAPHPFGRFSGHVTDPLVYAWSGDGATIALSHELALKDSAVSKRPAAPESLAAGAPLVLTRTTPPDWTLQGLLRHQAGRTFRDGAWAYVDDSSFPPRASTQLFLLDVHTGRSRQVTMDTSGYFTPDWSPDGQRLVYMSPEGRSLASFGPDESNLFAMEVATGRVTRLTRGLSQKTLPRWSPDGRWIAYLGKHPLSREEQGVYVVPSDGSAPGRRVTGQIDRYVQAYQWAPEGDALLVVYRDGLNAPVVRVDLHSGAITSVSPSDAVTSQLGIAASVGGVAWSQSVDPNAATELWVHLRGQRASRSIVNAIPPDDPRTARRHEALRWINARGDTLEGMIVYPRGYRAGQAYPVIVDVYGAGRKIRQADNGIVKVSGDYVLFRPNHRAPHMWRNATKSAKYDSAAAGPHGIAVMTDDILSGVDTLVHRRLIDPDRMCVFGFSNGGLQGELLLTQTDRFRCAVLQSPSTSDWLLQFFLSTDNPEVIRWMYGIPPWEDPALYTALIPLFHAHKISTPVLLAVGDMENRVTLATIEMYNVLRYLKKDVTLLRYANQGHGFIGAAQIDFEARMQTFFDSYLRR